MFQMNKLIILLNILWFLRGSFCRLQMEHITVGKWTYGHADIRVFAATNRYKIVIGSFCSIAVGMTVLLEIGHHHDWITTFPFGHIHKCEFSKHGGKDHPCGKGDVVIGNDVWFGINVTIMSGVHIGDGAVVAANSHVVSNVEPYSIIGGNPARLIRKRFSDSDIQRLLQIRWWDWEDARIDELSPLLCSSNLTSFFATVDSFV